MKRLEPDSPLRRRERTRCALAALLLWLAAPLVELAHVVLEPHAVCAQDAALVHGHCGHDHTGHDHTGHAHAGHAHAAHPPAGPSAVPEGAPHEHGGRCLFLECSQPKGAPVPGAARSLAGEAAHLRPAPPRATPRAPRIAPLVLAPKQSPPGGSLAS